MRDGKTFFEQVPIEVAMKAAEEEALANRPSAARPSRTWEAIARELSEEKDSNRITLLAAELNAALEGEHRRKFPGDSSRNVRAD